MQQTCLPCFIQEAIFFSSSTNTNVRLYMLNCNSDMWIDTGEKSLPTLAVAWPANKGIVFCEPQSFLSNRHLLEQLQDTNDNSVKKAADANVDQKCELCRNTFFIQFPTFFPFTFIMIHDPRAILFFAIPYPTRIIITDFNQHLGLQNIGCSRR